MKVTTIDGGFRGLRMSGLGVISSAEQITQGEWFNSNLRRYADARQRFRIAVTSGSLPQQDVFVLETALRASEDAINTHLERLSQIETAADLSAWRSAGTGLIAAANGVASRIEMIVGDERAVIGWKIGVGVVGTAAFIGLLAWWFTRS